MILKRIKVITELGEYTNCYIVQDEESKEALVIDPGGEVWKIIEMLEILEANLKYIYLTHCHADHIGGVNGLKEKMGGKILIHRFDAEGLENDAISLSTYIGMKPIYLEADSRIDDNDLIHIGKMEFKVIHTPGHTRGGSCIYCEKEKMLFTGDTMFRGTWGRTDLPTGSFEEIINSISKKLMCLPDDTICYPGHGKSTKVGEEKPIYLELEARKD